MAIAVVTGASSGIGFAIVQKLLTLNYEVIGLSRSNTFSHERYTHYNVDLCDTKAIENVCERITNLSLLVNVAGFGVFEPHEEISVKTISNLITLNLEAPILLTNLLLRKIKKDRGDIIFISSIEATRHAKFSALYSASKAGLRAFSLTLFEELRKSGVNTLVINPDMTHTDFFNTLRFEPAKALLASDIAQCIENVLTMREGVAVNEITLRAQEFAIAKKAITR